MGAPDITRSPAAAAANQDNLIALVLRERSYRRRTDRVTSR